MSSSSTSAAAAAAAAQQRQQQLQQQQQQQQLQRQHDLLRQKQLQQQQFQWAQFINSYPLNIIFPAKVSSKDKIKKPHIKTDVDLINARLLESGILFEDLQSFPQLQPGIGRFVDNLTRTGCFNSVQVQLGVVEKEQDTKKADENGGGNVTTGKDDTSSSSQDTPISQHQLEIILDEKKWYSLYIGGGFKQEGGPEQAATNLIHGAATSSGNNTGGGTTFGLGDGILGRLPKAQFETSATLLNMTGCLDTSTFRYTVDQTSTSSVTLSHERPLYSWFPHNDKSDNIGNVILALPRGSQYALGIRGMVDTVDYEWTRSYKEYQRLISCHLDNTGGLTLSNSPGETAPTPPLQYFGRGSSSTQEKEPIDADSASSSHWCYWGLDWTLSLRDVVPRRHSTLPYACDASPEIVALSGPSLLHSLTYQIRTNGCFTDNRYQPTAGYDWNSKFQLAGPPGDVGFIKAQGSYSVHVPLASTTVGGGASGTTVPNPNDGSVADTSGESVSVNWLSLHGNVNAGILQPISFSGICRPPTISDRFFVGGPLQLRGFLPAGIGPRAKTGGSTSPGGDALGGTLYYTATAAASMAVPVPRIVDYGAIRLFCFCNAGTVVGGGSSAGTGGSSGTKPSDFWKNLTGGAGAGSGSTSQLQGIPLSAILNSTRLSTGIGLAMGTPMGRLEATYSWPLRYGPRDARSNFQFGIGFNFG